MFTKPEVSLTHEDNRAPSASNKVSHFRKETVYFDDPSIVEIKKEERKESAQFIRAESTLKVT